MTGGEDTIMRESMKITAAYVGAGVQNLLMEKVAGERTTEGRVNYKKIADRLRAELKRRIIAMMSLNRPSRLSSTTYSYSYAYLKNYTTFMKGKSR